ncbi:LapA family protein [Propionivibrio sp.]|uniref:LapA family protein n=1 Tax=Propionivibrio sp. TaxID=2212460 RepID=UPI002600B83A|nr:LapA family protein [Propionivibrio sp.]MBK7357348.1 LapA family protein [Propionivibrio sp.]MBK8401248.1 LapA family protein [Propionivibrio sp.]MBK8743196.1 LapA family protein [Propionivibrio sp.]MBL0208987.1 LapA family protein [Propionivibrio sp.]
MQLTIIAAIFTSIVGVAFAMQNNVPVTVNFLLWRFDSSLAMVLLLALALGAIVIAFLTTPATLRSQWLMKRQKRRIEELEKTCDGQRKRIADLESHLPAEQAAPESRPYAGLMQLIGNREEETNDESRHTQA